MNNDLKIVPVIARPAKDSDGPHIDGAWIIERNGRWFATCANGILANFFVALWNESLFKDLDP